LRSRVAARLLLGGRVARRKCVGERLVGAAVRIRDAKGVERFDERLLRVRERHAVLRTARACEGGLDIIEVELDDL